MTNHSRTAATRVLTRALEWRLAPARWGVVTSVLDLVADAAGSGDADALSDAVERLNEAGSGRITRIGSTPTQPAPKEVRERIIVLVGSLSGNGPANPPARR